MGAGAIESEDTTLENMEWALERMCRVGATIVAIVPIRLQTNTEFGIITNVVSYRIYYAEASER